MRNEKKKKKNSLIEWISSNEDAVVVVVVENLNLNWWWRTAMKTAAAAAADHQRRRRRRRWRLQKQTRLTRKSLSSSRAPPLNSLYVLCACITLALHCAIHFFFRGRVVLSFLVDVLIKKKKTENRKIAAATKHCCKHRSQYSHSRQ